MPWLGRSWTDIQTRLAENRFPHALIINGERGVGKRIWASAVAELLLCDQPAGQEGETPVACGHCKQCELYGAGSHPDVQVYSPEKSKIIKIGQVRALSAFAVTSPQVAQRKVVIIDRADQLNINAANALLKTLEEPVPNVTLLLLQESGRPLLPTIRSRCQIVTIPVPEALDARAWLETQVQAMDEDVRPTADILTKALMLSGNAPRLALDYIAGDFITLRDTAFKGFRQFMKNQMSISGAAKAFKALGLENSLLLFEGWASDLARICAGGDAKDSEASEMLSFLARNNPGWRAHALLDAIKEARAAGIYNVNPELEAGRLLIEWQKLMPVKRRAN
jgi:DNA polymerase-3 subunit delta'